MGSTDLGSSTGSTVSEAPGIGTGTTTGDVLGSTGMSDMGPIVRATAPKQFMHVAQFSQQAD